MKTAYEDMLRKIVADYLDFEGNETLQKERLSANIDEACEVLGIDRAKADLLAETTYPEPLHTYEG